MFCARTTMDRSLPVGRVDPDGAVGIAEDGVSSNSAPRPPRIFPVGRAVPRPPFAPKINLSRGFGTIHTD